MKNYNKVLLIGLDGAPLELIEEFKDELPVIKSLMNGVYGKLDSVIPPLTPVAWTSMVTGVNPGKHNIFDFFKNEDYEKQIATNDDIKAKAIWDYLNEKNLRTVLINVAYTYPIKPVNGFVIAGTPGNTAFGDFTYPESLKQTLLEEVPGYKIGVDWQNINNDDDAFIKDLREVTTNQTKAGLMLLKENWDFFMIVFEDLDRIFHFHWRFMDKNHPLHNLNKKETEKYKDSIKDYMKFLDKRIGELVEKVDKNTLIILASDHGFGPLIKQVKINNCLEKFGFLKRKRYENKKESGKFIHFMYRLGFYKFFKKLPNKIQNIFRKKVIASKEQDEEVIDWDNTQAWLSSISNQSIRLNIKSRESKGIVDTSDIKKVKTEIISKLMGIKDNGKKVIKRIYRPEELYFGEYIENAPDLLIEMEDGYAAQKGFSENFFEDPREGRVFKSGDHIRGGFFAISGEGIKKRKTGASILDITPTILKNFNIKKKLDGKSII